MSADNAPTKSSYTGLAVYGYGGTTNTAQQIGTAILPFCTESKLIYLTLPNAIYDANACCTLVSLSQFRAKGTEFDYIKDDFVLITDWTRD
ncbi:hypothetical protein E4U28_001715 [Claviceps purpurea]|nr:hypothetical protein E4U28_001715 [Claviceps purpurea]